MTSQIVVRVCAEHHGNLRLPERPATAGFFGVFGRTSLRDAAVRCPPKVCAAYTGDAEVRHIALGFKARNWF